MSSTRVAVCHVILGFASVLWCRVGVAQGRPGLGGSEQDWGYITVRPNAHMFWWLYYTTADVSNYTERPLIMWLQGGPGMPSSGFGNFVEIGPLDVSFRPRKNSPVERFNVLFVDNPVGVGYSYLSNNSAKLVRNGDEIGEDLFSFFKQFMDKFQELREVPLYVFGESYGGKMATDFVYNLMQKQHRTGPICNLRGLGLGDAYISPVDYVQHFAPLALHLGLVDKQGFTRIDELAKQTEVLINKKEFERAADTENRITEELLWDMVGIDIYNFVEKCNSSRLPKFMEHMPLLNRIMNSEVRGILNLTSEARWQYVSSEVHWALKKDLVSSVTHKVEAILNHTDVKVIVYSGNLDFLVNTAGTISWMEKLAWKGKEQWRNQTQEPLTIDHVYEGYVKKFGNLAFYAVLRAGHSVPVDNLEAFNLILDKEVVNH